MSDHRSDKAALIKVHRTALSPPVDSSSHRIQQDGAFKVIGNPTGFHLCSFTNSQTTTSLFDFGGKDTVTG